MHCRTKRSELSLRALFDCNLPRVLEQAGEEYDDKANMESAQTRMEKSTDSVADSLETLRTGRARYRPIYTEHCAAS